MQRPRCHTCRADGIYLGLHNHPEFKPVEAWKFGHLHQCSRCGRYWFLYEHKEYIARIHDRWLPMAQHWNRNRLTVSSSLWQQLASIGGIANSPKDCIQIPCAVRNLSGKLHEKAIVLISKQPPYRWYRQDMVHWADEIAEIAPSPYALPFDVRKASAEKEEISMGFAPIEVLDSRGNEYTLNGKTNFFDAKGVKGEEITLSDFRGERRPDFHWEYGLILNLIAFIILQFRPEKHLPPRPPIARSTPAEAFYFVDWFEGCEAIPTKQYGHRSNGDFPV